MIITLIRSVIIKLQFWFLSPSAFARRSGVKIGKNCSIGSKYFGSEPYLIEIGEHVQITAGVKFFTHGGGWRLRIKYPDFDCFGKIKIGNNVYIGNNALIMLGVTIGNDVIVGSGSVVAKSIPSGSVVAGNPAKQIGTLENYENKILGYNVKTKGFSADSKKKYLLSLTEDRFIKK